MLELGISQARFTKLLTQRVLVVDKKRMLKKIYLANLLEC